MAAVRILQAEHFWSYTQPKWIIESTNKVVAKFWVDLDHDVYITETNRDTDEKDTKDR